MFLHLPACKNHWLGEMVWCTHYNL